MFLRQGQGQELKVQDDLFSNIKYVLIIGRLLFLFPCDGLTWKTHHNFRFRRNSLAAVIALLIILWYSAKFIISLKFLIQISHGGVTGYAHPAHYLIVAGVISFIYLYCFLKCDKLKKLFVSWENASIALNFKALSLKRMTRIALLLMISSISINTLFAFDAVYGINGREIPENYTRLEFCYERLFGNWHSILPFSPYFTILNILDFVYGALPRAFIFPLVIVFSFALSRQYKDLYETGLKHVNVVSCYNITTVSSNDNEADDDTNTNGKCKVATRQAEECTFWTNLVKKHNGLTELVMEFDEFLSPLIFITYFMSLYLICMQLLRALSVAMDGSSLGLTMGLTMGLSHFIFGASCWTEIFHLYFMSISAAQLNDYAHKIGLVLRKCPVEYQTSEISRLENRVNFGPRIGFTGLGCFVITKPFLLTIANTIITIEIVLLQSQLSNPTDFGQHLKSI